MQILIVDPYLTYSHKVWLDGLSANLNHPIFALTLPASHWKWRMHGGTLMLAQQFTQSGFEPDLIIATDMLDLSLFIAQCKGFLKPTIPVWLYFHENQLTYPFSALDSDAAKGFDNHYAFINFTSALLSDQLIFNSAFHLHAFMHALPRFINQFPKPTINLSVSDLMKKSIVIYPGFEPAPSKPVWDYMDQNLPIIVWNHRWEYDKDPETFFNILYTLSDEGYKFHISVMGQRFNRIPAIFSSAYDRLEAHIIHWGFIKDRSEYWQWLRRADIVISTSKQDFFGISMVEAISAGCYPLMPKRLAFPELIPKYLHSRHLYHTEEELLSKIRNLLVSWPEIFDSRQDLIRHVTKYTAKNQANAYKKLLSKVVI